MTDVDFMSKAAELMARIGNGAFLTVRDGERLNTMTIGWGQVGIIWGLPIFSVMVRDSRHTYTLIEKAPDFTVTMPWEDMAKQLGFCGSQSGRDVDKFAACGLETAESRKVSSPTIRCRGLHYECRTVLRGPMNPALADADLDKFYPKKDYHTFYFGEILACYETG